jgi:hypothetical protein
MHTFSDRCLPGSPRVLLIFAIEQVVFLVSFNPSLRKLALFLQERAVAHFEQHSVWYSITFVFLKSISFHDQNCERSKLTS